MTEYESMCNAWNAFGKVALTKFDAFRFGWEAARNIENPDLVQPTDVEFVTHHNGDATIGLQGVGIGAEQAKMR
jgi:hypothetical protein